MKIPNLLPLESQIFGIVNPPIAQPALKTLMINPTTIDEKTWVPFVASNGAKQLRKEAMLEIPPIVPTSQPKIKPENEVVIHNKIAVFKSHKDWVGIASSTWLTFAFGMESAGDGDGESDFKLIEASDLLVSGVDIFNKLVL